MRFAKLVFAFVCLGACVRTISFAEAKEIAQQELNQYCETQGITAQNITEQEVSDDGSTWLFSYLIQTNGKHEAITILVSRRGFASTTKENAESVGIQGKG